MKTTVFPHPPYSPDLTSCDLRIFSEPACRFQGRRFQSADECKSESQAELKDMPKSGFQKCFENFYKQLNKCVFAQGLPYVGMCYVMKMRFRNLIGYIFKRSLSGVKFR
ncbi:hypothetical protein TNCV_1580721 [Trichonephila clavipes]|nr:hypothetical protein TNCV_1580721 [Trichonephila clavipes]